MEINKKIVTFVKELHRRNALFFYLGIALLVLFFIGLLAFAFCHYSSLDICHWLKPSKFTLSFSLYLFSLAWYMEYLKGSWGQKKIVTFSWLIAVLIIVEMVNILLQTWIASGNYLPIHFSDLNTQTIRRSLYLFGNFLIIANVILGAYVGLQFFRDIALKPISYLWAIRGGFVIFILSGFLGGFLVDHYGPVPLDPNYYGIPFTRFSSVRDNIISMHFLGIHSLQILPVGCYYFQKYVGKIFVFSCVICYAVISLFFMFKA